jgi:outer membrane protein assembly factor BamB/precorrin-6B methylase 2
MLLRSLGLLVLALVVAPESVSGQTRAYWPQFRGPDRTNVAKDTGLLKQWPEDGPPLAWKVTHLGAGMAPVSVAEGRLYTLAFRDGTEYAVALDRGTGKEVWAAALGPGRQEAGMQFHYQRQPVIDNERLYAFSANAVLFCLETDAGRFLWKKDYRREFGTRGANFGVNDHPLVDGDRLICTPGGKDATFVALNKFNGEVIWKSVVPGNDTAAHSPIVVAEVGGIRQYIELLSRGLVAVAADDGRFLWRYNRASNQIINVPAPIVHGDHVFVSSAYSIGSALLKLVVTGKEVKAEEVYFTKDFQNLNGGMVLVEGHVYGGRRHGIGGGPLGCLELKTGKLRWEEAGNVTNVLAAEGHLYCRHSDGNILLVEATPNGYKEKSRFMQPDRTKSSPWTYLVLTGQRLYVRDQNVLLCYDLRAQRPAAAPQVQPHRTDHDSHLPDAVFIPSPQDVVEKMLELANVKMKDVVVDLGCGDGRIPITAAKKYGCTALGYDLDEQCVRQARDNARKHKVLDRVRILRQDLFKVDLRQADIVMLYLLPHLNVKLIPQLEQMKSGARIVSHAFDMKGMVPDRVITCTSKEDGQEHKLFLWTIPFKRATNR